MDPCNPAAGRAEIHKAESNDALPKLWPLVPLSVVCYLFGLPSLIAHAIVRGNLQASGLEATTPVSMEACRTVSLFLATSVAVSTFIDQHALHAIFLPMPAGRSKQRFGLPPWLCAFNWVIGLLVLCALLTVADRVRWGKQADDQYVELAVAFLGITYFAVAFGVGCVWNCAVRGQSQRHGLYVVMATPAIVYAFIVAYVASTVNSSILPLVVTTDTMILLSLPLLNAMTTGPRVDWADGYACSATNADGVTDRKPLILHVHLAYAALLGLALWIASPAPVAVLLLRMPQEWLGSSGAALQPSIFAMAACAVEVCQHGLRRTMETLSSEIRMTCWEFVVAVAVSVIGFFSFSSCCCRRDPHATKGQHRQPSSSELASAARRRLTKVRAASQLFPGPYPNGWYCLCRSTDVPVGKAIPVGACGKEFVVFRGEDKQVAVLNAFCPHLGTHLGHGGKVVNNTIVCPYHSWAFDSQGKCVDIPYCPKKPTERTHTKAFPVRERLGQIFVWLHADDADPQWEMTILDEIDEKNLKFVVDVPCEDWQMHIMEPSQNAADPYHFNTTHSWLGGIDDGRSFLWIRHECESVLGTLGQEGDDGKKLPETVIGIKERCTQMKLFGVIPLPKFLNTHYKSGAYFQGPQLSVFYIDSKALGSVRIVFTFTPEAPFVQRCTVRGYRSPGFPRFLAKFFSEMALATVNQDRKVWEHKLAVAPRNVVAGDGPFAAYGTWLRQFYSESSQKWGDISLEW